MMPLLKNTKYLGEVTYCSDGSFLFQYKEEVYSFTLFNILYSQEGALEACSRLLDTSILEVEIDLLGPSNEVYAFVNGELLQQSLIQDKYARIKIPNPEYKYHTQLSKTYTTDVSSELENIDNIRDFDRTRAHRFFGIHFFVIFLIIVFLIIRKKLKKVI